MNFGQLDIEEKGSTFINKYVEYGNQELMITGFELKASSAGDKHQIKMLVESPTVKENGFTPDEKAVNGGKIGTITVGIFADYTLEDKAKEIGKIMQLIAKKASEKYADDNLYNRVCAIDYTTMEDYLKQVQAILKGKFVWFQVCAEAYAKKVVESKNGGEPKTYDKYSLHLGRYGFVASKEEGLKPFDKNNKFHYGYSDKYDVTPDAAPVVSTTPASTDGW